MKILPSVLHLLVPTLTNTEARTPEIYQKKINNVRFSIFHVKKIQSCFCRRYDKNRKFVSTRMICYASGQNLKPIQIVFSNFLFEFCSFYFDTVKLCRFFAARVAFQYQLRLGTWFRNKSDFLNNRNFLSDRRFFVLFFMPLTSLDQTHEPTRTSAYIAYKSFFPL